MTTGQKLLLRGAAILCAAAAPVAFSSDSGVTANDACAQTGTCCKSSDSCIVNGQVIAAGYWQNGSGSCSSEVE